MPDCPEQTFEVDRLRERITALEADRSGLMASIRHMRRGQLDGRYLTDALRSELARCPDHGVLLETIEVELRCLREHLAERERGKRSPLRHWQEIDRRLSAGEFDMDDVVRVAIKSGLARRVAGPGPPNALREVWVIEPAPSRNLVPAPLVLLDFGTDAYGGPRIYRPVTDDLRWGVDVFP